MENVFCVETCSPSLSIALLNQKFVIMFAWRAIMKKCFFTPAIKTYFEPIQHTTNLSFLVELIFL